MIFVCTRWTTTRSAVSTLADLIYILALVYSIVFGSTLIAATILIAVYKTGGKDETMVTEIAESKNFYGEPAQAADGGPSFLALEDDLPTLARERHLLML